jgi:hypothetical protein
MEPRLLEQCPFCHGELPHDLEHDGRVLSLGRDIPPSRMNGGTPFILCPHCAQPVVLHRSPDGDLTVAEDQNRPLRT